MGGVEKKGRNDFQRYDYVKAADVAKAIRHELFQRGIVVIIDEKEWTQLRTVKTTAGELPEMLLKSEVTFMDGAETLGPFVAMATAMDCGDKAIYKAKTGLLKYVLRGIGLIPDERDDPEFDEAVDEQTDPRVLEAGEQKGRGRRKKLADFRIRAFDAACHQSGKTADQLASYLRTRFNAASISEISEEDFTSAIKWAMGTEELAETLTTSTQAVTSRKKNGQAQPVVAALDQDQDFQLA